MAQKKIFINTYLFEIYRIPTQSFKNRERAEVAGQERKKQLKYSKKEKYRMQERNMDRERSCDSEIQRNKDSP